MARQRGKPSVLWEAKRAVKENISACFFCASYCGLLVTLDENDRIVKVVGDKDNPNSKGFICNKGANLRSHLDSPHRLTQPLKRVNGKLEEVSWEQALREIGTKLRQIRKEHSPRSIALTVGGSENHTLEPVAGVLMLNGMGSRSLYSPAGLEFLGRWKTANKMYGANVMDGYPDFDNTHYAIIVGGNPLVSHPSQGQALKKAGKAADRTLVVVDPRYSETAAIADQHLGIRPSTDIYFLLCMLNVIVSGDLYDKAHVDRHSVGLEEVKAAVRHFTPEAIAPITGLDADAIQRIAEDFAKAESAILYYHMGVIANHHGTLVSWAVQTIKFITNNKGRKGGSLINPLILDMNALDKMVENVEKYRSRIKPEFEEISSNLPTLFLPEEILTPGEGQLRAMIVSGCNPLKAFGRCDDMEKAFDDLELIVSIDPFLTEVGRKAHYVLPSCGFQEQENLSFPHSWLFKTPFTQLLHRIREPLGDSWPEWKIYRGILKSTGPQGFANHITNAIFSGMELWHKLKQMISRRPGEFNQQMAIVKLIAMFSETSWRELLDKPHGFTISRKKPYNYLEHLATDDKKVHLAIPEFLQSIKTLLTNPPLIDQEFPLLLSTSCRDKGNTNTLIHNMAWQDKHGDASALVVHPDDAKALGILDHEKVKLISQDTEDVLEVSLSENVAPGSVHLTHGYGLLSRDPECTHSTGGVSSGKYISNREYDELTGMPIMSGIPCRIEKRIQTSA